MDTSSNRSRKAPDVKERKKEKVAKTTDQKTVRSNVMIQKIKGFFRSCKKKVAAAAAVATGALGFSTIPKRVFAENPLTTSALTHLADLQSDVVALLTVMVGVVVTMAIAGIIFIIVKRR